MGTIQVVLDEHLLRAPDRAAQSTRRNRSALIREALRQYLSKLEVQTLEGRDREGYLKKRLTQDEALLWEKEAAWPPE